MGNWRIPLVLAAAAVVVAAGCTTNADGSRVLGDLATIQPCSLTDPAVFAEFGAAEFGRPEMLDYCAVIIKPGPTGADSLAQSDDEITIMIGNLARPSADPFLPMDKLEDVADGLYTTKPEDPAGASCWQTLVFEDEDLALSVRSRLGPIAKPTPTCDMVTAGMAKVVEVLKAGKVEHRKPKQNSLVALNPCDLVNDKTITALPGLANAQRLDSPTRHECQWRTSKLGPRATVTFGVDNPPEPSSTFEGTTGPIAGRPSITTPSGRFCDVETAHIPFDEAPNYVETVTILVESDRDDIACEAATTVAEALWPRLPNP